MPPTRRMKFAMRLLDLRIMYCAFPSLKNQYLGPRKDELYVIIAFEKFGSVLSSKLLGSFNFYLGTYL